jgi:hypothetical protein
MFLQMFDLDGISGLEVIFKLQINEQLICIFYAFNASITFKVVPALKTGGHGVKYYKT